jgi:hypothetical protein
MSEYLGRADMLCPTYNRRLVARYQPLVQLFDR